VAVALSVLSSLLVGIILVVAPWTPWWEANGLLPPQPLLRAMVLSDFARGGVSGLGLVNILLAVAETREHLRPGPGSDRPDRGA
jgi:hypothetical protein